MGDKNLESKTNELEKDYRIVKYPAIQLPSDFRNLIIAPLKQTLRFGNDLFKLIDQNCYYEAYGKYIDNLLQRPYSIVNLAILRNGTVLGWSLYENKTLHYVWVKKDARRNGIAQALLPKEFDTISHITNSGINIWVKHYPHVRFNPF